MKKNRKGFTLIELLAVIVILAIIALIAVPIVLNLIEKSRKGSAVDSAYGLRKATQLYYSSGLISSPTGIEKIEFNCDGENCISDKRDANGEYIKLEIDGTVPTSGKITVNPTGELTFENIIFYNKYECIIEQSGPITCDAIKTKYITIKTNINSWAQNKTVTIDYDSSCTDKQYCIDGTTWLDYTGEITLTENVEVKAKATCKGETIEENYVEEKIDTTAPVLNAENPFSVAKLSPTSLQITVNEVEEDGEIYGYAFSIDGGLSYSEIQKSNVYIVNNLTPGETYKIKVKVYNGTYGKENVDESKSLAESEEKEVTLDTIAIELKVNPEGEVWASEKTVTIEGYPEGYDVKYKINDEETWLDYTDGIKVTENGTMITGGLFIGDVLVSNAPSVTVNYIDNVAPTITLGEVVVTENSITVPYTVDDENATVTCEYGTDTNYGSIGTVENGTCVMSELTTDTEYFFKLVATDQAQNASELATGSATPIFVIDTLPNGTYVSGEAVTIGGYNWHVVSDDATYVTLLMDADQIDDMKHLASSGTYSWNNSLIRTYLNETLYLELSSKIDNMITTEICADPSKSGSYGGYLMSELESLGKTSSCTTIVIDYVRLISPEEYSTLTATVDTTDWLYSSSISYWWTMGTYSGTNSSYVKKSQRVLPGGSLGTYECSSSSGVRPVITIEKK